MPKNIPASFPAPAVPGPSEEEKFKIDYANQSFVVKINNRRINFCAT